MILGIAGKMGSGKDSIADILIRRFGFSRRSMADALRIEASWMLDTMVAPVDCPDNVRTIIEFGYWEPDAVYIKPTPPDIRILLQWVGQRRREQDEDYWIKQIRVAIRRDLSASTDSIVIPDIRFENEASLMREFSGEVWHVSRLCPSNVPHAGHISERFADEYRKWDARIENNGTLDDLERTVADIMKCHAELARCSELLSKPELLSKSNYEGLAGGSIDWARELHEIAHP